MPRIAKELSALEVKRLTLPGMYAVGGVTGLHLQVLPGGGRTWLLRVTVGKQPSTKRPEDLVQKRLEIGLGGYPAVTLAQARDKAREVREKIAQGIDPIAERAAARSALMASRVAEITFKEAARSLIDAKSDEWRNPKHRQQWINTLETYAYPVIGSLQVRDIDVPHVFSILAPIWKTKTETAVRLRGRIESVLDWATARKYRDGPNPARWKGHLDTMLARPSKITKPEHHAALHVDEIGAFMQRLRKQAGMGSLALEFLILTAARSGEVRGATWAEIDLQAGVWTVPGSRMKAEKEHRVPLSDSALKLLNDLPRFEGNDLVFPAPRGGQLSDMTLTAVTRRMKVAAVPHGFRSTFRDWAAECTHHPREVAEMALAHTIESKVEAAYRRGDLFEKRRALMTDWATFCDPKK